ncbi:mycothiol synthase [Tomitella biformata]|uniref:mycothiol synthase n=1 Tax=Tomitella biformata TaxID=630403 RepID=UPI000467DD51|nr:mycothiol synthase [Tomitella biformata]
MSAPVIYTIDSVSPVVASKITAGVAAAEAADGVAPVGDGPLRGLLEQAGAQHLLLATGPELLGYANVQHAGLANATAEAYVLPAERGKGLGTKLVEMALREGGPHTRAWAHGNLPAAQAVAARLGLTPLRELLQLRRELTTPELPELTIPDSVVVRTYQDGDDAELLRVNAAAFEWHPEQGAMSAQDLIDQRAEAWFDPAGLFLAFDAAEPERLLGFHWTKVHAGEPALGEVYVVGIDPTAQGRGLGATLTLAGLRHLRGLGLETVLLYVEGDNGPALRTYERLGFSRYRADVAYGLTSDNA